MTNDRNLDSDIIRLMLAHPSELVAAYRIAFPPKDTTGGLTPRQVQLLDYIRTYAAANGTTPSYAEMVEALDMRSKSGIARLVVSLEERGFIRRLGRSMARSIVLVEKPA